MIFPIIIPAELLYNAPVYVAEETYVLFRYVLKLFPFLTAVIVYHCPAPIVPPLILVIT